MSVAHTEAQKMLKYLNKLPMEDREPFAIRCGTTEGQLRQIGYLRRPCNTTIAIALDRETGGILSMERLCPDLDWAYVKDNIGAPKERNIAKNATENNAIRPGSQNSGKQRSSAHP